MSDAAVETVAVGVVPVSAELVTGKFGGGVRGRFGIVALRVCGG